MLAVVVLLTARIVSTFLSVEPSQSLWGDQQTRAGTFIFACYVLLFAAIASKVRTAEQVERFVSAALVGSLPVSLYTLVQRFHLDPVNWGSAEFITSLVGHPLYLAAYLGMLFPLCLWRIWHLLPILAAGSAGPTGSVPSRNDGVKKLKTAALGFYGLLAILQLAALLLTQRRGPLVGLMAGLVCFFVLVSLCLSLRRLLLGTMFATGAVVVFLVLLNIPGGPLESVRSSRLLGRFSHGFFSAREGTGFFRADLWKQCPRLMLSRETVLLPDGTKDPLHFARPWFGYGPETTSGVLAQRHTAPHTSATLEDRFHNLVWDLWESTGGLGVAAFLVCFAALNYCGFCQLGLTRTRRDGLHFAVLLLGFSVGGALLASLLQGVGFCGLGLQVGLAAGCVAYGVIRSLQSRESEVSSQGTSWRIFGITDDRLLVIALLSALSMHLVETGFAFPTASTATLFWAFAGLLVALEKRAALSSQPHAQISPSAQSAGAGEIVGTTTPTSVKSNAGTTKTKMKSKGREIVATRPPRGIAEVLYSVCWPACLTTILLMPLISVFLLRYTHNALSALDLITQALDPSQPLNATRNIVPELLSAVWLGSAFLLTAPWSSSAPDAGWGGRFVGTLLLSGLAAGSFALLNATQLARIGPLPTGTAEAWTVLNQAREYESVFWVSLLVLLTLVLISAYRFGVLGQPSSHRLVSAGSLTCFGLLVAVVVVAIDLKPARAAIAVRWASVLDSQKVWPACESVFQRVIELQPAEFIYRSKLAQALRAQAGAGRDESERRRWFKRAEETLIASKGLPAYNRRAWHLGELYVALAERESNSTNRLELAHKAKASFEEALVWEPKNPPLWSDYAAVDLNLLGEEQQGLRTNQKALDIDPGCEQALARFADFYAQKSVDSKDASNKQSFTQTAARYYRQAADSTGMPFPYVMALGLMLMRLEDWSGAIKEFEKATKLAGNDEASRAQEMLARAYLAAGNRAAALEHVRVAIGQSAPSDKPGLVEFEKQLTNGGR
jgi:tetratricopeptide (TPR) repeat protein